MVLYQELLTYCHKEKYIAWPTIDSLCQQMGIAKTTLLRYQNTLLRFGLIKNIRRGKSTTGNYRRNIYQVTPLHMVKNTLSIGNFFPYIGEKITPNLGKKLPINNTNLNITNTTTPKKDVVVDFKKLKEEGEEKMQALRGQLLNLNIKESFIEKMLKEYPAKKIEEKLDLLMERRNSKQLSLYRTGGRYQGKRYQSDYSSGGMREYRF